MADTPRAAETTKALIAKLGKARQWEEKLVAELESKPTVRKELAILP